MKSGGKNKSVAFIILFSVFTFKYKENTRKKGKHRDLKGDMQKRMQTILCKLCPSNRT